MDIKGDPDDFISKFTTFSEDHIIRMAVQEVIDNLKKDTCVGAHVKKRQIPKYYITKHNIHVLYVVDLPQFWRLTYSIAEFEIKNELSALMLELMDHEQYNKRFGYFKKKSA
jgi:hypothetical protein